MTGQERRTSSEPELYVGTDRETGVEYLVTVFREDDTVSWTIAVRDPVSRRWGPPVELESAP